MANAASGRQLVAERGLTAAAVGALTPLMAEVGFEDLGLVKALLKRFFSAGSWTALDAAALAKAVGSAPAGGGDGDVLRHRLDPELTLVAGWVDDGFLVDVEVDVAPDVDHTGSAAPAAEDRAAPAGLGSTFGYAVVPEPTPNPRTIRFATPRREQPASTSHHRGDPCDDERVAAVFDVSDQIADVLVGADFVAVSAARPAQWPELLEPVLAVVEAGFGDRPHATPEPPRPPAPFVDVRAAAAARPAVRRGAETRLDRAWADLGSLHAGRPADLQAIVAAAGDEDSARRQVAAQLLGDAPAEVASAAWEALVSDDSRPVRRAALDAVVGAGREELRPLLERALADADGWMRWKALHGLVALGIEPSIDAVDRLADDPDFRVRLEAANARRRR